MDRGSRWKKKAIGGWEEATSSRRRMRVSRLQIQAIPGSKSAADIPRELQPPPPGRYFIHVAAAKASRLRFPQQDPST
jgi:hypothetical protein